MLKNTRCVDVTGFRADQSEHNDTALKEVPVY